MAANNFFRFKQFTVQQQRCAIKVSTDTCIFGAIVAENFAANKAQRGSKEFHYLDIGTGTGLLSLLLAQKTTALIDAVEINSDAYEEAKENFEASPFKERLFVHNKDILCFEPNKKYDGIICNPPFYEDYLRSASENKNAAKHGTALTLRQLLTTAGKLLKEKGTFAVLLPYQRVNKFVEDATYLNLHLKEKLLLRHSAQHNYSRGILFFTQENVEPATKELIIKLENGGYSNDFIDLLKDYYLHL